MQADSGLFVHLGVCTIMFVLAFIALKIIVLAMAAAVILPFFAADATAGFS